MKKVMNLAILIASTTILQCCSTDDPLSSYTDDSKTYAEYQTSQTSNGSTSLSAGSGTLTTFAVAIDRTTAEPSTTVAAYYPDDEDDLNANTFGTTVNISFNDQSATFDNVDGVTITAEGAHVVANHGDTKGVCYIVSGQTSAGSLTIVGNKKYELLLKGADITNPDSTAINLLSKKRAYVVLADGTTNRVADGANSKDSDQKGAFYCKGKLLFSGGSGSLEVNGNYKNGIHSADYIVFSQGSNIYVSSTAGHGVKANDGIFINGGILNVEVSATAAKGMNCESNITVCGGRTTVVTTGNGTYDADDKDTKASAAIACDSTFTMKGGELCLKSTGTGGKAIKASWEAYISGGTIYAITEGGQYRYSNSLTSSPKVIKAGTKNIHGNLEISGGTILARASGSNGECIESKGTLTVSGGTVQAYSKADDAINCAGNMYIKGGSIVAVGAGSDGLDANGNMYISGGNVVAYGASGAESGIDVSENSRLYVTGGDFLGIGGRIDATLGSTTQGIVSTSGSLSANSTVTVSDGTKTLATFIMPPLSYNNGTIMLSTTGMNSGESYTVNWGSSTSTVTASSSISGSMGMGGNMRPGGRW